MIKSRFSGIRPRIAMAFILFTVFVIASIAIPFDYFGRQLLRKSIISELSAVSVEKKAALTNTITESLNGIQNLAHSPHMQEDMEALLSTARTDPSYPGKRAQMLQNLTAWVGGNGRYQTLFLIDPADGRITLSTDLSLVGKSTLDKPFFQIGRTGPYLQTPYLSPDLGGMTMSVATPFFSPEGKLLAVLAGHLNLELLSQIAGRQSGEHASSDSFLVNLAHHYVTPPRYVIAAEMKDLIVRTEAVNRCLSKQTGVVLANDYRGVPAIVSYSWLADYNLCLIVKVDQSEALRPLETFGLTLALTGGVALLLGLLISTVIASTFAHPVREMRLLASRFGQGNFGLRMREDEPGELGELGVEFNRMADRLQDRLSELQTLNLMSQDINQSVTLDQLFESMHENLRKLVGVQYSGFYLWDEASGSLILTAHNEKDTDFGQHLHSLSPGQGAAGLALRDQKTVVFNRLAEYPEMFRESLAQEGIQSVAGFPILGQTGVVGALSLLSTEPDFFNAGRLELLEAFCGQVATGIEKARLYRKAQENEGRFRQLAEASFEGISVAVQGRLIDANQQLMRMLGYSQEEFIGMSTLDFIAPAEREAVAQYIRAENEEPYECTAVRKDGGTLFVEVRAKHTLVDGRRLRIAVVRDITEHRIMEDELRHARSELEQRVEERTRKLRQSQQMLRLVLDTIPQRVFWKDRDFIYLGSNRSFARDAGLDEPGQIVGKNDFDLVWAESAPMYREDDEMIMEENQARLNYEEAQINKDGSVRWLRTSKVPLQDIKGNVIGILGVYEDISARKKAEEELQKTLVELERSNQELEQFAYVASHDLQEPLRMVASYLQLLQRRYGGQMDAEADEFIYFAVDGANRMKALINDLLNYSRVNTRGKEFALTDCNQVLERVLRSLRVSIDEAQARISSEPLPSVIADELQLGQVFQNLIGNALKFHGEQPVEVQIGAVEKPREWVFHVKDNGIGIDPTYHERIFTIFQRLHSRAEYPGTGIGLSICKKIVERHGGKIWLESEAGKGTTFLFSIPKRKGKLG